MSKRAIALDITKLEEALSAAEMPRSTARVTNSLEVRGAPPIEPETRLAAGRVQKELN